jgi:hypothetical protein
MLLKISKYCQGQQFVHPLHMMTLNGQLHTSAVFLCKEPPEPNGEKVDQLQSRFGYCGEKKSPSTSTSIQNLVIHSIVHYNTDPS